MNTKSINESGTLTSFVRVAGNEDMSCSGIPDPWLVDVNFTCSPAYTITQADIDAGSVNNSVRWVGVIPIMVIRLAVAFAADMSQVRQKFR